MVKDGSLNLNMPTGVPKLLQHFLIIHISRVLHSRITYFSASCSFEGRCPVYLLAQVTNNLRSILCGTKK